MSEWLLHLPVVWMALVIFAGTRMSLRRLSFGLVGNERGRVIDPGVLSPLGVVFGLLVLFTAAQVWGDLERASSTVATEASALRAVVLLADNLPENEASNLRALVKRHIETSETEEWPAMVHRRATPAMPTALNEALRETLAFPAADDVQKAAQHEIVSALQKALDARRHE